MTTPELAYADIEKLIKGFKAMPAAQPHCTGTIEQGCLEHMLLASGALVVGASGPTVMRASGPPIEPSMSSSPPPPAPFAQEVTASNEQISQVSLEVSREAHG